MHFVYILESLKNGSFYIRSSSNPNKRLIEHNRGSTCSTKRYRPWQLVYIEQHSSKSVAEKREWYLKHSSGYLEKKAIISHYGTTLRKEL